MIDIDSALDEIGVSEALISRAYDRIDDAHKKILGDPAIVSRASSKVLTHRGRVYRLLESTRGLKSDIEDIARSDGASGPANFYIDECEEGWGIYRTSDNSPMQGPSNDRATLEPICAAMNERERMESNRTGWRASVYPNTPAGGYVAGVQVDTKGLGVMQRGETPLEAMQALYDYVNSRVPFSYPEYEVCPDGTFRLWVYTT